MPAQRAKNYLLSVVFSATPASNNDSEVAQQDSPAVCTFCHGTGMAVVPGKGTPR